MKIRMPSEGVELLKALYVIRNIFYPIQLTVETRIESNKVTIKVQGKTTNETLEKLEEKKAKLKEKYPKHKCIVRCTSFESIHDHDVYSEWEGIL